MMANRFLGLSFVLVLMLCMGAAHSARAQDCRMEYEQIVTLGEPRAGSYNIWDSVYGELGQDERFAYALARPEWKTVVTGEVKHHESGEVRLIFERLDHRGRPEWEKSYAVDSLDKAVKVLEDGEGFLVLANLSVKQPKGQDIGKLWFGRFDENGELTAQKTIGDRKGSLEGMDILPNPGGAGFILAASFSNMADQGHARMYVLNSKLDVVNHRAYVTGTQNRLEKFVPVKDGQIAAAGYAYGADGRKNGWVVMLDRDYSIVWQRQYPRGKGAGFQAILPYRENHLVVAGQADPVTPGSKASWLMMLERDNGNILWQRYLTDALDNDARDMLVDENNLISLLVSGKALPETEQKDFVRLLTVNGYGMLLGGDSYFNANGAEAYMMLTGPKRERILAGRSDVIENIENAETGEITKAQSMDGWVVVGVKAQQYVDPCAE